MATQGTLTANGNSGLVYSDGPVHIHLSGAFGGGTMQLSFVDNDGTERNVTDATWTAATDAFIELAGKNQLRLTLTGATGPALAFSVRGNVVDGPSG